MGESISRYEVHRKRTAERNVFLVRVLVNDELLEVIWDEGLEGASVREVEEDNLFTALRKRAGVEAPLRDLTEFMDTLHAESKMKLGGQIGHRVLKVKANLRVCRKKHGWRENVYPGGDVHGLVGKERQRQW